MEKEQVVVSEESRAGTKIEHQINVSHAIKTYPKVLFWCFFLCLPIIGIQYDETVMGGLYAMPAFQKRYGVEYKGHYIIPASWQSAISMSGYIGQIVGGLGVATYPLGRFGPRKTLAGAVFSIMCCIFIQFFSSSLRVLFVGEFLAGIISGSFVVISVSYASEIAPLSLRAILSSYANLCAVIGQFIGSGIMYACQKRSDQWAYRIPFAVQWWWIIIFLIGIWFAPESPYWLVRRGQIEEAERVLVSISRDPSLAKERVLMIKETNEFEKEISSSSSIFDCFKGANIRRTEICTISYIVQVLGGGSLMGYSTYFFELAGLDSSNSFAMGLGAKAFSFVGTILSWSILALFGRRSVYFSGQVVLTCFLFLVAFLDLAPNYDHRPAFMWTQAVLLDLFSFVYDFTVGPLCYVVLGEMSSTRLRGKTIAVALALKAVIGIVMSVSMPYMMNANHAHWRGKAGFFFGGFNVLFTVWAFYRIPETKGRTFEELDILFERGVPARHFKKFSNVEVMEME